MQRICCCLILVASLTSAHAEQPREPEILRRAWSIWYPIKPGTPVHERYLQLKAAVAQSNWKHAIDLANGLTEMFPTSLPKYEQELPWEWRVAIADLYVYDGRLDKAAQLVESVFTE